MLPSDHKFGLELIILALACWRLSNLLVAEEGPWNVLGRIRGRLIDQDKLETPGSLSKGLSCPYCVQVWLALAVTPLYLFWPSWTLLGAFPLALAGIGAYLQKQTYDRSVELEGPEPSDSGLPTGPPDDFLVG